MNKQLKQDVLSALGFHLEDETCFSETMGDACEHCWLEKLIDRVAAEPDE